MVVYSGYKEKCAHFTAVDRYNVDFNDFWQRLKPIFTVRLVVAISHGEVFHKMKKKVM